MDEVKISESKIDLRTMGPVGTWRALRVGRTETTLSAPSGPYGLMEAPPQVSIATYPIGRGDVISRDGWLDVRALEEGSYSVEVSRIGGIFIQGISEGSEIHFCWGALDPARVIKSKKLDVALGGMVE